MEIKKYDYTGKESIVYERKILMIKLTDVLLAENLISPDEKVKILKHLKEGDTQ